MPKEDRGSAVTFSHDGSTVIFRPKLPHRGMGKLVAVAAVAFMLAILLVVLGAATDRRGARPEIIAYFLIFGALFTVPLLGLGLHLATRRRLASVNAQEVVSERTSWMSQRRERYALSDFAGLKRHTVTASETDAETVGHATLGAIFGLLAAAAGGGAHVMVMGKTVTFHCLSLSPRRGAAKEILLVMDREAALVSEIMQDLAHRFSLDVLVPSSDGQAALRPDEIDLTLGERTAAAGETARPLAAPPARLEVETRDGRTTVLLPPRVAALIGGAVFSLAFMALVVVSLAAGVDPLLVILPFAFAVGFALLGYFGYRRRSKIVIGPEGVVFEKFITHPMNSGDRRVRWRELRHVAVAAPVVMGIKGKKTLHVMTDAGDFFLANPRLTEEESQWLAQAITDASRRYACGETWQKESEGDSA